VGLVKIADLPELEIAKGIALRAVNTQTVTVAHVKLTAGSILPEHAHYHEQVVNVIEGELELTVEGKPHSLVPGRVMVLPPNIKHSGRVISDCRIIDVFHPAREDFRGSGFGGYPKKS
jgi:quercetin dioxygenase-like cupin family protein